MEEKIKWFGRYLGCKYMWTQLGVIGPNQSQETEVNATTLRCLERDVYLSCKLILKELKDISDEDLMELNEFNLDGIPWERHHFTCDLSSIVFYINEIDLLRSRGYAVGIPRELYVTEKELNTQK